jgi:hypothetical protein
MATIGLTEGAYASERQPTIHPKVLSHFRLRCVPKFGKDTIRQFTSNASHLRKIAAHDFEDILQVWITALTPESNT